MSQAVPPDWIDHLFTQWDRPDTPGCAVAVIRAGEVIYAHGYGCANLEYGVPLTPTSVFVAGSVAKQFTACAILLLARDGLLSLDDSLRRYVADAPMYCEPVTIRHLLHHTGGLRDHWALLRLTDRPEDGVYSEDDIMDLLYRQQGLVTAPGEAFCYSNPGYILLSMVVRQVSGYSFRAFMHERIFTPLGMRDTHFHDDHRALVPRRADGHEPATEGGYRLFMPHGDLVGNGGLMTTVEDLARWDGNFYTGAVGGPEVIAQLQTAGTLNNGDPVLLFGQHYTRGLLVGEYRGLPLVHHPGGNTGYRAQLARFPVQRISIACLGNVTTINAPELVFRVAELYLEDQMEPRQASADSPMTPTLDVVLSSEHTEACPGLYDSAELATTFTVTLRDGTLWLRSRRGQEWALRPVSADDFAVDGLEAGYLTFMRARGGIVGFRLSMDRAAQIAFSKQASAGVVRDGRD